MAIKNKLLMKIMKSNICLLLFAFIVSTVSFGHLMAQTTQGAITGTVKGENQSPIAGASVIVKNESTGFTNTTTTNSNGQFNFKQLPLGKPYTIRVTYIGYSAYEQTGYALNQGDILRLNISLASKSVQMDEVEISASNIKNTVGNFGAATSVTGNDIQKLPVNGRNFTSLIDLSPMSNGNSMAGQLASSTNFTLDGMTSRNPTSGGTANRRGGSYAISMEAIREFKIVTNQYDVTYGRSGGGTINTVTKSGTNTFTGSAFGFARADWLSSPYDIRGNKQDNEFSTYQYGFSLGGPIVKDKAHFYVTWDHQADARPFQVADIRSPEDEKRYNVTQSTLDQFLDIARNKYGVASSQQFGSFDRKRSTDAIFARVDWQLNNKHLLTLRENFVYDKNNHSLGDNSKINLYEVYGSVKTSDNSFLATLRSVLSPKITNELKAQHLYTSESSVPNEQLPGKSIPRAIIQNISSTIDGKEVLTDIQLGGQRYIPEYFYNNVFQLSDNLYYNTEKINYTFGTDIMYTHMKSLYGSEMNGRFYFTGLEEFNNLDPYRYAREIALEDDPSVKQNILTAALYAQMQTKLGKGLDMMAGIRADYTSYINKPNFNQLVYDELGLNTSNALNSFILQPRIQFTWDINEQQRDILKFGAGIFGSDINNYAMINNMVFDGTKVATIDVQRNAPGAPLGITPNFPQYRQDPSTAPGYELFEQLGISPTSTINMNGSDAKIPTVYKGNISYNRLITNRLKLGLSLYASLARNNYMYVDKNMVDEPFFRIANEANRGVYVPASTINTANGSADWQNGRKSTKLGRVLELNSEGKINQYAVVLDGTYQYYKDGVLSFSYTWNDSKDNTSFNGDVANTATLELMTPGDPRDLSRMAYSNTQFRHKLVIYGALPTFYGISIGLRYSGIGGTRYSLAVNGNVNGDFVNSNDLAYIFDPNNTNVPEAYRNAIQQILDNPEADAGLKEYIKQSIGQIAERNGGTNGFYGTWDLRITKRFTTYKSQYIELSGDIFNLANLLNKDWGVQKTLGKQNIYNIRGFDPTLNVYNYNVNTNVGVINPSGNPYQIQIGIRYGF
jgi:hypothetical protein